MSSEESLFTMRPLHSNGHQVTDYGNMAVKVWQIAPIPGVDPNLLTQVSHTFGCRWCGKRPPMRVEDDGVYIDEPCSLPHGITTTITLEVPSGRIIVGDDLRSVYSVEDRDGLADYNSVLGQAQYVEAMAELSCAYGPVGNSCPDLWKTGDATYLIGRMPVEYDEEDEDAVGREIPTPPGSVRLAAITTDLWAYSVADYEDWLKKGGTPIEEMGWSYTVVDVPAGTYRFTHHTGERDFDHRADDLVYAHIERIA